jgi:hypothetical protein
VVAFDFDPIHRYQTLATFRLVWNAILSIDLDPGAARGRTFHHGPDFPAAVDHDPPLPQ